MMHVCDTLGVEVPDFTLQRRIHILRNHQENHFEIHGSRSNQRHSFITRVEVFDNQNHRYFNLDQEPFLLHHEMLES